MAIVPQRFYVDTARINMLLNEHHVFEGCVDEDHLEVTSERFPSIINILVDKHYESIEVTYHGANTRVLVTVDRRDEVLKYKRVSVIAWDAEEPSPVDHEALQEAIMELF